MCARRLIFLLLVIVFRAGTALGDGNLPTFIMGADWGLNQQDQEWLQGYLADRWELAHANVTWANQTEAPHGRRRLVMVRLHPTIWKDPQFGLVEGVTHVYDAGDYFCVDVAWDFEQRTGLAISHEFAHVVQYLSSFSGWDVFGHGTPGDPFLQRMLEYARLVYIPGQPFDPFRSDVY